MSQLVVDTSAVVALLGAESGAAWLGDRLTEARTRLISAATVVELGIVTSAQSADRLAPERILDELALTVVDVDRRLALAAVAAWRRFGKGRHPAGLNMGDCHSYALARLRDLPILCVGKDFPRTDVATLTPPDE